MARHLGRIRACVYLCICSATFICHAQGSNPGMDMCNTVAKGSLKDENYSFSDEVHFNELKNLLSTRHFSSYQDWQSAGQSMGLSVPVEDVIVGFDESSHNDASIFQKELDTFLSSDYQQAYSKMKSVSQSATFNQGVLELLEACERDYVKTQPGTYVSVDATDAKNFLVTVNVVRPSGDPSYQVKITTLEPHDQNVLSCTKGDDKGNSVPIHVSDLIEQGSMTMTCIKDEKTSTYLKIGTNMGMADAVLLPEKNSPPASLASSPPKSIVAIWSESSIQVSPTGQTSCSCLISTGSGRPEDPVENRCGSTVIINAMKDPSWPHPSGNVLPFDTYGGREFAQVTLNPGDTGDMKLKAGEPYVISYVNCPGENIRTLTYPPPPFPGYGQGEPPQQQKFATCMISRATLQQAGAPLPPNPSFWFVCDVQGMDPSNGVPCSCPVNGPNKYLPGKTVPPFQVK
jgi:hypothetical protein